MKKDKEIVKKNDHITFKKHAFIVEEYHPALGRMMIVDGNKYKILDEDTKESGTFIKNITEEDEELMEEYDRDVEELAEKLVQKVDIKRLIKEQIKSKPLQDIKTGLFILKKEEDGEKIEEEHHRGCYHFKMFYKNQCFNFIGGDDVITDERNLRR